MTETPLTEVCRAMRHQAAVLQNHLDKIEAMQRKEMPIHNSQFDEVQMTILNCQLHLKTIKDNTPL